MTVSETYHQSNGDSANKDDALLSRYASIAVRSQLAEIQNGVHSLPNDVSRNKLAPCAKTLWHSSNEAKERHFKVGIIGAGVAGLFTGMLLDHFKDEFGLDVEYEILETNGENRVGGRLFTHYFGKGEEAKPRPGNHNYYDVGGMRFPNSKVMEPTFGLFNVLGMKEYKPLRTSDWKPQPGDLIPYLLSGNKSVDFFNDKYSYIGGAATAGTFEITGLPEYETAQKPDDLVQEEIGGFVKRLQANPGAGWRHLMKVGDNKSVRQFFLDQLDFNTAQWLETISYATGWYDQALSEYILEDVNFRFDGKWFCVEGGAQQTPLRMFERIEKGGPDRVSFRKTVTKIERQDPKTEDTHEDPPLVVHVKGETTPREYDAVFNSAPLGSMQRMDLRGLNLNWGTKQAIRALGYGASCKVGIKFKKMWWMSEEFGFDIQGGVAHTDLPIRMCVYPSYNLRDPKDKPGVLLCSYSWSTDAQRMGTFINRESPEKEEGLKELVLQNLAKLHSDMNSDWPYEKLLKELHELYEEHFAYDWYKDEGTSGAFAYFGPGQFQNMYPYIIRNDGKHVIIGEAASSHHAWVVGAIESAVRGVYQFLYSHSHSSHKCSEILEKYHNNEFHAPWGPVPVEFNREKDITPLKPSGDVVDEVPELGDRVGEWLRQGVLVEKWRLRQGGDRLDASKVKPEEVAAFTAVFDGWGKASS